LLFTLFLLLLILLILTAYNSQRSAYSYKVAIKPAMTFSYQATRSLMATQLPTVRPCHKVISY